MSALVHLTVSPPAVRVGQLVLSEQWTEFYALLALRQRDDPAAFVTVEGVHRLESWALKKPGSVGKEVARHLVSLRSAGLAHVVVSPARGKTRAWRLGVARGDTDLSPSPPAVAEWLETRTRGAGDGFAWTRELHRLVGAALLLRDGRGAAALEALGDEPSQSLDATLAAWRALQQGRALYVAGEDDELARLDTLIAAWSRASGPVGRAVEARLRAIRVMRERFFDAAITRARLTKLVAALERHGDVGSLGVLHNVLGVLERRAGDPSRALEHLSRAIGLLGLSGDWHTLQAALYNAAQAHHGVLKRRGRPPDELAFALLDLCLRVCREFHVGNDSALAEITRADWLLQSGRADEAEASLREAREILGATEASYDQAYFMQVRARLLHARGASLRAVTRDLRAAIRVYAEVGDHRAEVRARALLKRFTGSRGQ